MDQKDEEKQLPHPVSQRQVHLLKSVDHQIAQSLPFRVLWHSLQLLKD